MRSNARPAVRTRSIGSILLVDREDRLDPQRRAELRLRRADAPAAAQELERVDREPELRSPRGSAARRRPPPRSVGAAARRVRRRERHEADAGRSRSRESTTAMPLRRDAALDQRPRAPARPPARSPRSRRRGGSRRCRGRPRAAARRQARKSPTDGCDVLGSSLAARRSLVERVEVGEVGLAVRSRPASSRTGETWCRSCALDDLAREVMSGVGDDGDAGHGARSLST